MNKKDNFKPGSNVITPLWPNTAVTQTDVETDHLSDLRQTLRAAELAHFAMHNAQNAAERDSATIRYSRTLESIFKQLSALSRAGGLSAGEFSLR